MATFEKTELNGFRETVSKKRFPENGFQEADSRKAVFGKSGFRGTDFGKRFPGKPLSGKSEFRKTDYGKRFLGKGFPEKRFPGPGSRTRIPGHGFQDTV